MDDIILDISLFYIITPSTFFLIHNMQKTFSFIVLPFQTLQKSKLKSPVLDINNCLNKITDFFILFHPSFFPGLRLVNYFIDRIAFHFTTFSKDKDIYKYIANLNNIFQSSQTTPYYTTVICHILEI